ncbi:MAG: DUF2268 domain-containing protein [Lachnospiraceae bacterium]|nr:DUF2268 domain-containing protein [Lachnospiraceae bacterium]
MNDFIVKAVRSDDIYRKILNASMDKKDDIYRYEFMQQFEKKWEMYHCPLKAKQPGGYDVVMASGMLGYLLPQKIGKKEEAYIDELADDKLWAACAASIEQSLMQFVNMGIDLRVKEYLFTLALADPESPYSIMCDNYSGDGGIPGYIFGFLVPSAFTKSRMPIALAHETNHNVRFQYIKWSNDISLGEYMICEGLAENFAVSIYGEENVGPWVSKTDEETLNEYIKPLMQSSLEVRGFEGITAYMYGDELAKMQNYIPAGMPYCAGYACGYYMVKYYLEKTGKNIIEATILPAEEILKEIDGFWEEITQFRKG